MFTFKRWRSAARHKDSPNTGCATKAFAAMPTTCKRGVRDALETLIRMSRQERAVIMCAEAVPWRCHRSLVADALTVRGIPAVEILSESSYRMHKLAPFARVEGTRITYHRTSYITSVVHARSRREKMRKTCRDCLRISGRAHIAPTRCHAVLVLSCSAYIGALCIVGQAPSRKVHETGIPWNDRPAIGCASGLA